MKSLTIRQLAQTGKPLILPGAHDALSALLIRPAVLAGMRTDLDRSVYIRSSRCGSSCRLPRAGRPIG